MQSNSKLQKETSCKQRFVTAWEPWPLNEAGCWSRVGTPACRDTARHPPPPTRLPSPIPSQAQKNFPSHLAFPGNSPSQAVGLPRQFAFPHSWPSQAIRLRRQLAFPGSWPSQAVGLPRQFAFAGSWPSQAVGLPRQLAFPGSWPSQAVGLPRQLWLPSHLNLASPTTNLSDKLSKKPLH